MPASAEIIKESFPELLDKSFGSHPVVGTVVNAKVVDIDDTDVLVDLRLKSNGKIPLSEFSNTSLSEEVAIGDTIQVFLARMEGPDGEIQVSRERARRVLAWPKLQELLESGEIVHGYILRRKKGGYAVDIDGMEAYLPASQADLRVIRDLTPFLNMAQPFRIIKLAERQSNIVVSRKQVLEEDRAKRKQASLALYTEGQVVEGTVKNITDYGAFIDLGGLDGLLHVTDIAWVRVAHPSEVLTAGQKLKVKIINLDHNNQRVSLGLIQLEPDPWTSILERYTVGQKLTAVIDNVVDYGLFATLEPGIEGLIHVSEISWTRRNLALHKLYKQGDQIDVVILEIDPQQRRISLGHKQCWPNPWEEFMNEHKVGTIVTGKVKSATEFGLFIGLTDQLDGMVYIKDIDWSLTGEEALSLYKRGDEVQAKILEVNLNRSRISLGIKQTQPNPRSLDEFTSLKVGDVVTCVVTATEESMLTVQIDPSIPGYIRRKDLSLDRRARDPLRFAIGDRVDAKILSIKKKTGSVYLSIRAREQDEEQATVATYGNVGSGAALGDMFGATLASKENEPSEADVDRNTVEKPAAKKAEPLPAEQPESSEPLNDDKKPE